MKQIEKKAAGGKPETADELAGNKLAGQAAINARAILQKTRTVNHYRCASCRSTTSRPGGVCKPIPVYED